MNRMSILQICTNGRRISDYIFFLADSLIELSSNFVLVSNGVLSREDKIKLQERRIDFFERPDDGFDSGAFKDVLENYVTWDVLVSYDELVLVNDSCYGPIYPLEEMFTKMDFEKKDLDYWSITEQKAFKKSPYWEEEVPYHVQPYFIVIRKKMLCSQAFKNFWRELQIPKNYLDAVNNYELKFANYFINEGFKGGAYVDCTEFCTTKDERQAYIFFNTYRLVSKYRCPMVKRKAFRHPQDLVLTSNAGEVSKKTLEYIKNNTDYDENMIIKDLIRDMSLEQFYLSFHLNYIVREKSCTSIKSNVCIALFIENEKTISKLQYIEKLLPEQLKIYVLVLGNQIERNSIGRGRKNTNVTSASEFANIVKEYDYVCVISDRIEGLNYEYGSIKQSLWDLILDNMLGNRKYLCGIQDIFENEKNLGILFNTKPYHASFFSKLIDLENEELGTVFGMWMRREILLFALASEKYLKESDIERVLFSKRVLNVLRQKEMYYGTVINESYASLYNVNYQFMLNGIVKKMVGEFIEADTYQNIIFMNQDVVSFCNKSSEIYIYGAGLYGHHCLNYLKKNNISFRGFIVSDGKKSENKVGEVIYELSEICLKANEGIIVAVGKEVYSDVVCELNKRGISNIVKYAE